MTDRQPEEPADELRPTDPRIRQLQDLVAGNNRSMQELARDGIQFDPIAMVNNRINLLAKRLLTPEECVELDLDTQREVADQIAMAKSQIARSRLLQGVNGAGPPPLPGKP